ncbi:MAG: CinA family protein, partial [Geminicoccaceae bacterium]|nr:CinA family protein [Geminicoccaceae bacterium]
MDALAAELVVSFGRRGVVVATAESCTGGLIAASITDVPGSSAVLDRGFVTYSNAAKMEMLGVEEETLMKHGAVSREVAAQ